jgi:hypothetical protein
VLIVKEEGNYIFYKCDKFLLHYNMCMWRRMKRWGMWRRRCRWEGRRRKMRRCKCEKRKRK